MKFQIEDYSLYSGFADCICNGKEMQINFTKTQLIEAAADLRYINAPLSCDENEVEYFSPAFPGQMQSQNLDKVVYLKPLDIINELSGNQILKILEYICTPDITDYNDIAEFFHNLI